MNRAFFLAHWRSGLLGALAAMVIVLLAAMARSPQFAGVIDLLVLPKRVDSPQDGEFARKALSPDELRTQFAAFGASDGLRQFLSKQDILDLGGGAFAQGLVEEFRKRISVEPLPEQGKIRMRVEDTRPLRAAVLTENLAASYRDYLENCERERRQSQLEAWKEKVAAGENKLTILRQAILSFRRMYLDAVEKYGGEKREDWRQSLVVEQLNSRIGVLEEQVKALSDLSVDDFLKEANLRKVIDRELMDLASQYIDRGSTMRSLDASGLSKDHVEVLASHQRYDEAKKRLETGISRMKGKLQEEEKQEKQRRTDLLTEREKTWGSLGEISKRIEETKSIYETESVALAQTQARLYAAQLESSLPVRALEYDEAKGASLEMNGPSFLTDLILAPVVGLLFGLLIVHLRAWRIERREAREIADELPGRTGERKDRYAVAA